MLYFYGYGGPNIIQHPWDKAIARQQRRTRRDILGFHSNHIHRDPADHNIPKNEFGSRMQPTLLKTIGHRLNSHPSIPYPQHIDSFPQISLHLCPLILLLLLLHFLLRPSIVPIFFVFLIPCTQPATPLLSSTHLHSVSSLSIPISNSQVTSHADHLTNGVPSSQQQWRSLC